MKQSFGNITLKHLLINDKRQIGLQFYPNERINRLLKTIPDLKWSEEFSMHYLANDKSNFNSIYDTFRGIAWINGTHFFKGKVLKKTNEAITLKEYRKRPAKAGHRLCPDDYLQKLESKRYSLNTAKTYISCFEKFINHFSDLKLLEITNNAVDFSFESKRKHSITKKRK